MLQNIIHSYPQIGKLSCRLDCTESTSAKTSYHQDTHAKRMNTWDRSTPYCTVHNPSGTNYRIKPIMTRALPDMWHPKHSPWWDNSLLGVLELIPLFIPRSTIPTGWLMLFPFIPELPWWLRIQKHHPQKNGDQENSQQGTTPECKIYRPMQIGSNFQVVDIGQYPPLNSPRILAATINPSFGQPPPIHQASS